MKLESTTIDSFLEQHKETNIGLILKVDLEAISASCETLNIECFIINGNEVRNQKELLDFLYSNLKFPEYFGFNWDALWDVLVNFDLDHLPGVSNRICLLYKQTEKFFSSDIDNFFIFVKIISDLVEYDIDEMVFKLILEIDPLKFQQGYQTFLKTGKYGEISYLLLE